MYSNENSHPTTGAYVNDTIVSLATAPGAAGIAVVRLSGPLALSIAESICDKTLASHPRQAILTTLSNAYSGSHIDRAIATYFKGPESFTGDDVVEFSTHGGHVTPDLVVQALIAGGARQSEAGEFSLRAFLNGKMDLPEAEAIHDQIVSIAPRAQSIAAGNVTGRLSAQIRTIRDQMIHLMTTLEHELDFSEEEIDSTTTANIVGQIDSAVSNLERLQKTAPFGRLLRDGARVVLAGPPNAGKSSLFNALVGREQAIVTDIPGTTRDALEGWINFDGFPVCLIDTAGLHAGNDPIESLGIERSHDALATADLILAVDPLDPHAVDLHSAKPATPILYLRSKVDTKLSDTPSDIIDTTVLAPEGLDSLHDAIIETLRSWIPLEETAVITSNRQKAGVDSALERLTEARTAHLSGASIDLLAADVRIAADFLAEVIGETTDEDVLHNIFSSFCIGK